MTCSYRKRLEQALASSLEYILEQQYPDGSWTDWNLPPGQSSIWTTAFVGLHLKSLPADLRARGSVSAHQASEWLYLQMFSDGGWGYNKAVGSDADSTAIAILFLSSEGIIVPDNCYSRLLEFQCEDGGFATYGNRGMLDSWTVSHPDVTPTAVLALLTNYPREHRAVERGTSCVLKQRTTAGVWESFWWTSFLYATEVSLTLLSTIELEIDLHRTKMKLLSASSENAFESALLISSLMHLPSECVNHKIQLLTSRIFEDQESNGSWRSSPVLRLPRHDCFEPWKGENSDLVFADDNRLFATSTALSALSKVYELRLFSS